MTIFKWKQDFIKRTGCKPVVYISGPMTGLPGFNFNAFDRQRDFLIGCGFDVISPADLDRQAEYVPEGGDLDKGTMKAIITRDMAGILDADAVVFLPGSEKSKGATAEYALAHWYGIPSFRLSDNNTYERFELIVGTMWTFSIVDKEEVSGDMNVASACCGGGCKEEKEEKCCGDPLGCSKFAKNECSVHCKQKESNEEDDILSEAKRLVCGDRNNQYGPPTQDFERIAELWSTLFDTKFTKHDVAVAMICLKLSRIQWSPEKRDHWVDIAGYSQCGWWCAKEDQEGS